jgi:hydroxymethylbilane synthase
MHGLVGSISGGRVIRASIEGDPDSAETLGISLAQEVLGKGAKEILDEVYRRGMPPEKGEISS